MSRIEQLTNLLIDLALLLQASNGIHTVDTPCRHIFTCNYPQEGVREGCRALKRFLPRSYLNRLGAKPSQISEPRQLGEDDTSFALLPYFRTACGAENRRTRASAAALLGRSPWLATLYRSASLNLSFILWLQHTSCLPFHLPTLLARPSLGSSSIFWLTLAPTRFPCEPCTLSTPHSKSNPTQDSLTVETPHRCQTQTAQARIALQLRQSSRWKCNIDSHLTPRPSISSPAS